MNNRTKTLRMVQLALLVAVELVFAYTPLGYMKPAGLEITFLMVPVSIGAILLGPSAGAILGGVFGLTSFSTCFGTSPFGAALLAINPIYTFIVCVIPRILAGWLAGVLFHAVNIGSKGTPRARSFAIASLAAPLFNTLFFMSGLVLCFYSTDYIQNFVQMLGATNPFTFVIFFVGVQGAIEAAVCWLISGLLCRALWPVLHRSAASEISAPAEKSSAAKAVPAEAEVEAEASAPEKAPSDFAQ